MFNFKKTREFSEILEDVFHFVKQEIQPLGYLLLNYAGPFILLAAIAASYFQGQSNSEIDPNQGFYIMLQQMNSKPSYWVTNILSIIANTILAGTVYGYIKHYIEKGKNNFDNEEVLNFIKENFVLILITNLVVGLATMAGALLFIIGAVYIGVSLSLTVVSRIFENKDLNEGFVRSFTLTREKWWFTFGIIIIVYAVIYLSSILLMSPATIYSEFINKTVTSEQGTSILFLILSTLGNFASSLLSGLLQITIAILYFSLIEEKESPGLNDRIGRI